MAAGVLVFLRVGLDGERVASSACRVIERNVGMRLIYGSADLKWLSNERIELTVHDLKAYDSGADRKVRFHAPRTQFEISFLSLLRGVIRLQRVSCYGPVLIVEPAEDGRTIEPKPRPAPGSVSFPFRPEVGTLEIRRARVLFHAPHPGVGPGNLLVDRVRADCRELSAYGLESFEVAGSLRRGQEGGTFALSGSLAWEAFDLYNIRGRIHAEIDSLPVIALDSAASLYGIRIPLSRGSLSGNLDFSGDVLTWKTALEARLIGGKLVEGDLFESAVDVDEASLRADGEYSGGALVINLNKLVVPGLNASAEFKMRQPVYANTPVSIKVHSARLEPGPLFRVLPIKLLPEKDRKRLLSAEPSGTIEVKAAHWEGKPGDLLKRGTRYNTLVLDARLDNVSAFVPWVDLRVSDASGTVRMNADELNVSSISLRAGRSPITANGWITNLKSKPKIKFFVSLNSRLEDLKALIDTSKLFAEIPAWIERVQNPQGRLKAEVDIAGMLDRPRIKGRIDLKDASCSVEDFPLPVTDVSGSVNFRGTGATLSDLVGKVGNTEVQLAGDVSPQALRVTLTANVTAKDFEAFRALPPLSRITGKGRLEMTAEGSPKEPSFEGSLDLKHAGVEVGNYVKKPPGVPLLVETSMKRVDEDMLVEQARIIIGSARISARGKVDEQGRVDLRLGLPNRGVQTSDLLRVAHPSIELKPGGRVEGNARIRTGPGLFQNPDVTFSVRVSHVSGRFFGFHKPETGLTGRLRLGGGVFNGFIDHVKIGNTSLAGDITIRGWRRPEIQARLVSESFDAADFGSPPGTVSTTTWGEWIERNPTIRFLARSTGSASLKAERGQSGQRTFSSFTAKVEGRGGVLHIPGWSAKIAGGTVRGSSIIDIRPKNKRPLRIEFQGEDLKMKRILLSNSGNLRVEGNVQLGGFVDYFTSERRANDGVYKVGKMEVRIKDGTIHRFEVLSKIFSLINFGSLLRGRIPDVIAQGLPFKSIEWKMEVFHTKWKIKDLKLESDAATIDATGMYFADQNRVDFDVEVSPLVGLDRLMQGLFGGILDKDPKTLVTAFKIRGLAGSPDVRLVQLEQFR